jgi:hypothetical protein
MDTHFKRTHTSSVDHLAGANYSMPQTGLRLVLSQGAACKATVVAQQLAIQHASGGKDDRVRQAQRS